MFRRLFNMYEYRPEDFFGYCLMFLGLTVLMFAMLIVG